ncbi:MAG: lipopolysaccharide biosynthesis protein [Clostridia bacterium]
MTIGICIIPFLEDIVGKVNIRENLNLIFLLYLTDVVVSYLLTYKRSILYADQKTYIINIIHIGYLVTMNTIQIAILLYSKNFILYLITKIVCRALENIVITKIANKRYPYLKEKNITKISKKTKSNIVIKIKGLFFHKIGSFLVLGTDNIIISKFLGVVTVGLYSNYNLIIQAVSNLFGQIFASLTATVGNLLLEKNNEKSYKIYKNVMFLNSCLFTFASVSILCLIEPFITLWIGIEYILPYSVLVILVINFYLQGIRKAYGLFKEAAGIFYEDRFVPLIESIVNIVSSLIFVKILGLEGVFLGTIASCLVLYIYSFPKFVYKGLFGKNYTKYIKDNLRYMLPSAISIIITAIIIKKIIITNIFIQLLVNAIISLIVPNLIMILIFYKTDEVKYYKDMLVRILGSKNINL